MRLFPPRQNVVSLTAAHVLPERGVPVSDSRPRAVRGAGAWLAAAVLIAILMLAAVLRFSDIGAESYWLDEIIMVNLTGSSFDTIVDHLQSSDRPPVYVLLGYAWARLFGSTEAATRSLSAVAGVASVAVMYAVGSALYRREVGLLAALIMAVSAFQVWYSQEYRYYAVFQLVVLIAALFYILWLKHGQAVDLAAHVLFAALAAYVHTYAIFFYVGLGLHFLTLWRSRPRQRGLWIAAQVLIVLAVLPRLLTTFSGLSEVAPIQGIGGGTPVVEWLPPPPLYAPFRTLTNFLFIQRSYLPWAVIGIAAAVFVIGLAAFALPRRAAWLERARFTAASLFQVPKSRFLLVLLWLGAPLTVPFILSHVFAPMYLDRFLISAAPAWYLLIALVIWTLRRLIPVGLSLAVLLILCIGVLRVYYTQDQKEAWRQTADYIAAQVEPGDALAISYGNFPGDAYNIRDSFSWYYPLKSSTCFVDVRGDRSALERQINLCGRHNDRLWLVVYTANPEGDRLTLRDLPERYPLIETQDFVGTTVYLFDLES
jgi:mannosyltransferase